jgi:glutamine amidotransferase
MIIVIDYDMGNVGSVLNMLKKAGAEARLSHGPEDLLEADKLILPGVGSFDEGMTNLARLGYLPVLKRCVLEEKRPILGICLGMQLFMRRSEEGVLPGLGWIGGDNMHFRFDSAHAHLTIPHMGWNEVSSRPGSWFFVGASQEERFYFVHSYHAVCDDPGNVLATTRYGYDFASAVLKANIVGTQFHPEKSHRFGMAFLSRFAAWDGLTG